MFLVARKPPVGKCNRAGNDGDVKKDRGGTVRKSLRARARSLRRGDEPHDSGESGLVPNCRDADAKASATGNCSRNDFGTCPLRYRFGLARDHGLVNIGSALNDSAICGNAGSGPDENDVANAQLREGNRLSFCAVYALSGVREQGGECIERATSLGNGPHFQPVAEDHDRDQ